MNALILAKILLTGEDLHFGTRFKDKPASLLDLYKCLVFTIFLIGVHIVERVMSECARGRSMLKAFRTLVVEVCSEYCPWERPCLSR